MPEASRSQKRWLAFAGCVLLVAVLYFARAVLMPVALAILLTFVLGPPVARLQRWMGRVPAVLATVSLGFCVLGLASWGLGIQLEKLTADLPSYRTNIREKVADIRRAGSGSSVMKVQDTIEDIKAEIGGPQEPQSQPIVVHPEPAVSAWGVPTWLDPFLEPLATAGLVITLVIFMLLRRDELRGRLIGLVGRGHLAVTTRALEDAATRISRQLLTQSFVNTVYGLGVGFGLFLIGVPYAALWGVLAAVLRFVPYVGAFIGAAAPTLVAVAALPGWGPSLWVIGLFVGLELLTNLCLETVLYADVAGVSQVALLISLAFWTWLWGPVGLLMGTSLTVCLVVLGKHVPGLQFVTALMTDAEPLAPDIHYYQRLLAHDPSEASDLVDRHLRTETPETVYDTLMLPALNYAARDRLENRLSPDEEVAVVESTRELLGDVDIRNGNSRHANDGGTPGAVSEPSEPVGDRVNVLGWPANADSDAVALGMLKDLLDQAPVALDIRSEHTLPSDLVKTIQELGYPIVCIADLPPRPSSRTRYLIKKLRSALPDLKIVVGRWAPPVLADDGAETLVEAGADRVGSTLVETRSQLGELARLVRPTS